MMKQLFKLFALITGKNNNATPKELILEQMHEPRPLPMGRKEFMEWSNRIISGAVLPKDPHESKEVFEDSIRYALCNMLLHLDPKESHKPDVFFIHSLRKYAVNQVADMIRKEIFVKKKATEAKENEDNEVPPKCPVLEFNKTGEDHA